MSIPNTLTVSPTAVRRTILDMLYRSGGAHLGSNMSAVEMLIAMYAATNLDKIRTQSPDRDRIVISKGHCACAVYAVLHHYGLLSAADLETYLEDGSALAGLVSKAVPYVEHSTGALGHGLSVAVGCALGLKTQGHHDARVLCLVGDGELHEGSNWEALMLAGHHKLSNLTVLIDDNRIGMIDDTDEVLTLQPLPAKLAMFGFRTAGTDGVEDKQIAWLLSQRHEQPLAIVCTTIKGEGVPFAEQQPIWHYKTLNAETYAQALRHLDALDGLA